MSSCPEDSLCPAQTVYDPPEVVYEDYYHPQVVNVVHQVEVIRRHHCVPVPHHVVSVTAKDVFCGSNPHDYRGSSRSRSSGQRKKR
ncbi:MULTISPECIES: hypothetical protein [Cohnella]|uniref:hypothetical protein n=1 Tax=Cohnella TaxID=329857 RepID=UPI001592C4F1|nr:MULTISPECIES: hypothetical protein [Cohnella]MBN2984633.1 hypothetical protein [Cohnella algarum]